MMENMKLFSTFRLTILKALSFMLLLSVDFFKINFFKHYISNSIRVSNNLDPDQDPDLDPNCLQRLSAYMGLDAKKPVFGGFSNNKGADQPAHPRSLISTFVIHFLESIISKLATCKISIF